MTVDQLAERITRLEQQMADLQARRTVVGDGSPQAWLSRAGMFKDDPTFWAAVKAGEEYRQADKPKRRAKANGKPRGKHVGS